MAATSFFLIGCMKQQHDVILESTWETDLIITRFPASRTGLLTPLLTCLLYSPSPFYLDKIILSPTPFLPFSSLDKSFLSPIPLLSSFGRKFSKSNFFSLSLSLLLGQNYSKSNSYSTEIF